MLKRLMFVIGVVFAITVLPYFLGKGISLFIGNSTGIGILGLWMIGLFMVGLSIAVFHIIKTIFFVVNNI